MDSWSFDATRRQITLGERTVQLTGRETEAFQYLLRGRGQLVAREVLEAEVWGMAPGSRSETVPVTIRKIRAKLGPEWRHILEVVRGRGYRIIDRTENTTVPCFGTPFFPRPGQQRAVKRLFEDGWRVVSVVGPGGIGKTRLVVEVASSLGEEFVFIHVGDLVTFDEVVDGICRVLGLANAGLQELRQSLHSWRPVLVLDEVEGVLGAVSALVEHLREVRFVVTSRRDLGRSDEAVHAVAPLEGPEGRAFARASIRANRWTGDLPDDSTLDALLDLVDGLPLGVEVASGRPMHPREVVDDLRSGAPRSGGDRLEVALAGSYDHLDEGLRRVLHALCVPRGALPESAISDWLGPGALDAVEELGRRSLLSREGRRWRVLRTMRRFVRAKDRDVVEQTADFDRWLFTLAGRFCVEVWEDPEQGIQRLWPLLDDMMDAVGRSPRTDLSDVLWVLALIASLRGPLQLCTRAIQLTLAKAPQDPLVSFFSVCSPGAVDFDALPGALGEAPSEVRFRAGLLFVFSWLPVEVDVGMLLPIGSDDPRHQWLVEVSRGRGAGDAVALRDLAAAQPVGGLQAQLTSVALAQTLTRRGAGTAERHWMELVESTENSTMGNIHQLVVTGLADARVQGDSAFAVAGYRDVAKRSIRRGLGNSWAVGRCGLWILLLDGGGESRSLLLHGAHAPHARIRDLSQALLRLLDHREGRVGTLGRPGELGGVLVDGTSLSELVGTMYEVEGAAPGTDPRELSAWTEAPDTVAFRVWKSAELRRRGL